MRREPCARVILHTVLGFDRGVIVMVGDEKNGAVLALSALDADSFAQALAAAARELVRSEPTTSTEVRQ